MNLSRLAVTALGLAFCPACVLVPQPVDVAEVREFPEYGGWLPVTSAGRVEPRFVRPLELEAEDPWLAPATRAEALERIAAQRNREALRPIEGLGAIVATPVLLPVALAFSGESSRHEGHGLLCRVRVLDERGNPLRDAQVEPLSAVVSLPVLAAEDGRRLLGGAERVEWRPNGAYLESLARTSERFVTEPVFVEWQGTTVLSSAGGRPWSVREVSAEGGVELEIRRPSAAGPESCAILWAPGYEPALCALAGPDVEVRLRAERQREALIAAVANLRTAQRALEFAPRGQAWFQRPDLDFKLLDDARGAIESLLADRGLPGWLRANAHAALQTQLQAELALYEHAGSWTTIPPVREAKRRIESTRAALASLNSQPAPASRRWSDDPAGVGALNEHFGAWLARARAAGLDEGERDGDSLRAERTALFAEASELLERAERIDPDQPLAFCLRAALAYGAGDQREALRCSRHIEDELYFELFYSRLRREQR